MIDYHPPIIPPNRVIADAIALFQFSKTGCLLVVCQEQLVGIVTERDVIGAIATGQGMEAAIAAIMVAPPIVVSETDALNYRSVLALMHQHQVQYIPVVNRLNQAVGLITQARLLQSIQSEEQHNLQPQEASTAPGDYEIKPITHPGAVQQDLAIRQPTEQALQDEERLQTILQNMPVMLDAFDENGIITIWNQECERVTGYSADEIVGNPDAMKLLYPDSEYLHQMLMKWKTYKSGYRDWEWELTCKDGSVKTVAWSNVSDKFVIPGWAAWGVGIDVTDRKRKEADRQRVETEIFNALAREKELNELKTAFVTMASHEFRTPLAIILSSTELLQSRGQEWAEEKRQIRYRRIIEAVNRITLLLNNVLLVGQNDAGKLQFNPAPLDIIQFCYNLIEELQLGVITRHSIKLVHTDGCCKPSLDAHLLRYVLINLISNSIRYSPQGGEVQIHLICRPQEIIFHIQDQGSGMSAREQDQLLAIFQPENNISTLSETGLGLGIVKRCVDLQNGSIEVESEPGKGALFTVKLPFSP